MSNENDFHEAENALKNAITKYYKACQEQELDDEKFCEYLADAVMESTESEDNPEGIILGDYIS